MAWLQNLAGKAEDLLNKIDQNAATVFNETKFTETRVSSGPDQDVIIPVKEIKSFDDVNSKNEPHDLIDFPDADGKPEMTPLKSSSMTNSLLLEDCEHHLNKILKLELENEDLNKKLLNLQHLYSEINNENFNLKIQLENSNYIVKEAKSEMEQYKARAQRILQEKKEMLNINNDVPIDLNDNILTKYNQELQEELNFQQNKNKDLSQQLMLCKKEINSLQQQIGNIQNTFKQTIENLEKTLKNEKLNKQIVEDEYKLINHKLNIKEQELTKNLNLIKVKNEEIQTLQDLIKEKKYITNENYDLRLKSLTDKLMQKQSDLETVTTERNALRIKMEKLENEHQNLLLQYQRSQMRIINVNDTDDDKSQVPHFMKISPLDIGMTRRVKHAYSTLDAISIRTGVFLRRYPLARIFVFCYMIILQLWALFVLFWYAPSNR